MDRTRQYWIWPHRSGVLAVLVGLVASLGCDLDPIASVCRTPPIEVVYETPAVAEPEPTPVDPLRSEPVREDREFRVVRSPSRSAVAPADADPDLMTVTPTRVLGIPPARKLQPIDAEEPAPAIEVDRIELAALPAMVGTEQMVLAIARLMDRNGQPVADADLEWMLDRAGVGTIISVGGRETTEIYRDARTPEYARVATSGTTYRLEEVAGLPEPTTIHPGESWCLLRTFHAGDMLLTVRTPHIATVDRNQASHRLHWVEAKLESPSVIEAGTGTSGVVVARVVNDRGEPLAGYAVLFEVADETGFLDGDKRSLECRSDSAGFVRVELERASDAVATTSLKATLFGPVTLPGTAVALSERLIEIRWARPEIEIALDAPPIASVKQVVRVRAHVRSSSKPIGTGAVVSAVAGDGLEVLTLVPEAAHENGLRFVLATLSSESDQEAELSVTAREPGERRVRFEVRDEMKIVAAKEASIRFVAPVLTVEKHVPRDWQVGVSGTYRVVVKNAGLISADDVVIEDETPSGLRIDETDGVRFVDRVRWQFPSLEPGKQVELVVRATPESAFERLALRAWARERTGGLSEGHGILTAAGVDTVEISIDDLADPIKVAGQAEYVIHVVNRGTGPAKDVGLKVTMSDHLHAISSAGSLASQIVNGRLELGPIGSLEPGQQVSCRVRAEARKQGDARIDVRVSHPALGTAGVTRSESTRVYDPSASEEIATTTHSD